MSWIRLLRVFSSGGIQAFLAGQQHASDPVERVMWAATVSFLFALHASTDLVEGAVHQLRAGNGSLVNEANLGWLVARRGQSVKCVRKPDRIAGDRRM
jgi:hypothetical protein